MSEELCDALDSALMREKMLITEIARLEEDRDKWESECKIAYKAFEESNIKKTYESMHQSDIEEHNRMTHELAIGRKLIGELADALDKSVAYMDVDNLTMQYVAREFNGLAKRAREALK